MSNFNHLKQSGYLVQKQERGPLWKGLLFPKDCILNYNFNQLFYLCSIILFYYFVECWLRISQSLCLPGLVLHRFFLRISFSGFSEGNIFYCASHVAVSHFQHKNRLPTKIGNTCFKSIIEIGALHGAPVTLWNVQWRWDLKQCK